MRNHFIKTLMAKIEKDPNIFLITADAGLDTLAPIRKQYPANILNVGIAEASMVGIAAGMAMEGWKPFVYTIAPFLVYRALEQIRNDICYQNLPVCMIGIGCGYSYGTAGATHQALEDLAPTLCMPNLSVYSPADTAELDMVLNRYFTDPAPSYIRLSKTGGSGLHKDAIAVGELKPIRIRDGKQVAIVSTGTITNEAIEASKILEAQGMSTAVFSLPILKPLDTAAVAECMKTFQLVFVLEEHNTHGGLCSLISRALACSDRPTRVHILGNMDVFSDTAGSRDHQLAKFGLGSEQIVQAILAQTGNNSLVEA